MEFGSNKSAANRFFSSQEIDYPAFPEERQGDVNIEYKFVNIMSRQNLSK